MGERGLVSIGKRNTFDDHLHSVSLPGLYFTYIHMLNTINFWDVWRREDKRREGA